MAQDNGDLTNSVYYTEWEYHITIALHYSPPCGVPGYRFFFSSSPYLLIRPLAAAILSMAGRITGGSMSSYDFDIGIIGGGAAGLTVAAGASQLGARTLLIEKEKELGGDCLHFGCVPSKTLIKTANVYHLIKKAKDFGLPAIGSNAVDFRDIAQRIQSVIDTIQRHDSKERFCKLGVRVEFGYSFFKDEHAVLLNGKTFSAKTWVIATGSSPSIPEIEGLDKMPYITNRELFSLDSLPASLIIIGGGPIGIEMAQAFCRLGSRVSVIERGAQILSKEDSDMAADIMDFLTDEGVTFHLNTSIVGARAIGADREIVVKKGDRTFGLRAKAVLIAAGRGANLKCLGLEGIGVEFERKGLRLDKRLRTTHSHIYAAGDVTGDYQFTHAAGYEGGVVLGNAIFHIPRKVDYSFFPWCTFTDPELACIGMNEKMAAAAGIEYGIYTEKFKDNDRSLTEGNREGKIKMLLGKRERLLGVQILGPHAGDLIGEWVAVMNGRVKLSALASSVHPYPTLGEINKKLVSDLFAKKLFSDRVRKGLTFLFSLKGRACD
jgi:pyruvate/2-oxoglutarate dehydrogenase complex dihydrolipoamide dehydrogenase (E3) component